MNYTLTISGKHYENLKKHLFPGDGKEAVAIALCGRHKTKHRTRLLVHEIIPIPYENCQVRNSTVVKWSTEIIIPHIEKAAKRGMAILKIHSHPTGFNAFSMTDDHSDKELFESIFGWMDNNEPHASAVMLPDGEIFARTWLHNGTYRAMEKVTLVGDDVKFWSKGHKNISQEFELRNIQTFGEGTTSKMKQLKIGVVGCSGTGSPLIEQLVRLGVGQVVLVDPDKVEKKNLNRIINSTMNDAKKGHYKVDVIRRAISRIGLGTKVHTHKNNMYHGTEIISQLADCDFLFGCMDSVDGRHLLNQIATFYLVPYIDLGVKLQSDGKGGIDQIMGSVHYLQPGGSSLRTRKVYTDEDLRAASMYRTDREHYEEQKKSGYIVDINVESPAVISINTQVASTAVNEFLSRIHPFRFDPNSEFAVSRISFIDAYLQHEKDGDPDTYLSKFVGRGDINPLLNMPELTNVIKYATQSI